jgi:4-amino-4-deoxy-L-arabinose transferase-like glycosyltransferase
MKPAAVRGGLRTAALVSSRRPYLPLAGVLAVGVGLRVLATVGFWPAYIANPDAFAYLDAAGTELFKYTERPSGYPVFLRAADFALFGEFPLLVALQHLIGVVAGVLMYLAMRRFGAPRALALVPAAVVLLTGDQVFFEHAVLSEALFGFLVAAAIWCASHVLAGRSLPWAMAAGGLLAVAATVRTVGLFMLPLLVLWVVLARPGGVRSRLVPAVGCAVAAIAMAGTYVVAQREYTGFTGFARTSGWSLYARVAHFADCSTFTPPRGTAGLCQPDVPEEKRPGATFYHHDPRSPAWRVFGQPPNGNKELRAFAREAIVHQPLTYAGTVAKDVLRYLDPNVGLDRPRSGVSPNGLSFSEPRAEYLARSLQQIELHWEPVTVRYRFASTLRAYQRIVRVHGPLLPLLLALALAGLWWGTRPERLGIVLLGGMAVVAVAVPSATLFYSWRYLVPLLPPLVGAAALGGFALARQLRARYRAS